MLKSRIVLSFLLLMFTYKLSFAQTEKIVPELYSVDTAIYSFMKKWKIHGGSVSIVKDGKLLYARSFGTDNFGRTIHNSTLFNIASLSKPITAVAILKLIEENKLQIDDIVFGPKGILNDSIYRKINDKRIYKITVRNLLQHTAGWDRVKSSIGDPMFHTFAIARRMNDTIKPASKEMIIQYMLTQKLDFNPGQKYAYSNLGYNILGRVLEKITGQDYENYIQSFVLKPMGINDMRLALNEEFNFNPFNKVQITPLDNTINIESMDAHGGWKATSSDMVRFLIGKDLRNNIQFLNSSSTKLMVMGSDVNPGYGLGWFVNKQGNYWHTGSIDGASAFMAKLSNGLCAVVLLNGRPLENDYFKDLDQVVWSGLKEIKKWPEYDLFLDYNIAVFQSQENLELKKAENTH